MHSIVPELKFNVGLCLVKKVIQVSVCLTGSLVSGKEVDHLVKIGFTVIGPQCAMTILKHNKQLKGNMKYPVYNLTMMGTLVCFSNIQPEQRVNKCSNINDLNPIPT